MISMWYFRYSGANYVNDSSIFLPLAPHSWMIVSKWIYFQNCPLDVRYVEGHENSHFGWHKVNCNKSFSPKIANQHRASATRLNLIRVLVKSVPVRFRQCLGDDANKCTTHNSQSVIGEHGSYVIKLKLQKKRNKNTSINICNLSICSNVN